MKPLISISKLVLSSLIFICIALPVFAQPSIETGGQKMPNEWIDPSTGHKIIKLTRREGNNMSFYFHNNPFVGNKMIFYGTDYLNTANNDSVKQETGNIPASNKQLYSVDLKTLKVEQLTYQPNSMNGEIVAEKNKLVYYQVKDSVFSTHIETKQTKLVYVFPADFKASITTINADETLLGRCMEQRCRKRDLQTEPRQVQLLQFNL